MHPHLYEHGIHIYIAFVKYEVSIIIHPFMALAVDWKWHRMCSGLRKQPITAHVLLYKLSHDWLLPERRVLKRKVSPDPAWASKYCCYFFYFGKTTVI